MKATRDYSVILVGFALVGLGLSMMLRSGLGMSPWGAFEQGISRITGITFGRATQIVGLFAILIGWMMKVKPSLVTVLNMVFVGFFADVFLGVVPVPSGLGWKTLTFALGLALYSVGISMYLGVRRGSGPSDSLMLGLCRIAGWSIRASKVSIDITVLVLALAMQGPIGIGTVAFALLAGPCIQFTMKMIKSSPALSRSLTG